jgi:hypothetical protein
MEAICSSETSVEFQRTTEDITLHNHRCEKLKSYKVLICLLIWIPCLKLATDKQVLWVVIQYKLKAWNLTVKIFPSCLKSRFSDTWNSRVLVGVKERLKKKKGTEKSGMYNVAHILLYSVLWITVDNIYCNFFFVTTTLSNRWSCCIRLYVSTHVYYLQVLFIVAVNIKLN